MSPGVLATVLGALAADYPDVVVRELAADRTRMLAAARLGMPIDDAEAGQLVAVVGRVADRCWADEGEEVWLTKRAKDGDSLERQPHCCGQGERGVRVQ